MNDNNTTQTARIPERDRPPRSNEQWAIEERIAQNTACAFEGCDGGLHDFDLPETEWRHQVHSEFFAGTTVEVDIVADPTKAPVYFAYIEYDAQGEMTEEEIRQDAWKFAEFPMFLGRIADKLSALNAAVSK